MVISCIVCRFAFSLVVGGVAQSLLDFDSLCLVKLVLLLLKRVVGYHFVINTIVELPIVVELVLPIYLATLLGEPQYSLFVFK